MNSIEIIKYMMNGKNSCELKKKDSEGNVVIVVNKINMPINIGESHNWLMNYLPQQYIEFLYFSNGMELFNYDDVDGLELLSIQEIEKYTQYAKKTFDEYWLDNIIIFGKIIGEDNYLGFRVLDNSYEILDCYFEDLPKDWKKIEGSFDSFLQKYLLSYGEKFWI